MRGFVAALAATGALIGVAPGRAAAQSGAGARLHRALARGMRAAGGHGGAYVVDLTTGRSLFSWAARVGRLPASVEKLYTTTTALLRFGPATRLTTSVLGVGSLDSAGTWHGTLYLKGDGDPTFGSQSFDHFAYGTGATMQQLVASLERQAGIKAIDGAIVGDESYFDSLRGTPPFGYRSSPEIEGLLSALAYDRGLANEQGTAFQSHPARFAAHQFASALRAAGVAVPSRTPVYAAPTPTPSQTLAVVHSPKISWLIHLTNTPSDNFFAEMLLKGLGAAFGGAGTTAAGAGVVRAQLASFGLYPHLEDGSGLSRLDSTSPRQVVSLLGHMAGNPAFVGSLAVAGETGTLQFEMHGTAAQGKCVGKTGTLRDVANLAGYCTARDGHKLAFAFLLNGLSDPAYGHALEARMAVTLAKYNG